MFDPIVVWFGVAVLSASLAWIVAAGAHHARLARFGALVGISAMLVVAHLAAGEPWPARSSEVAAARSSHHTTPHHTRWRHTTRAITIATTRAFDRVVTAPTRFVRERRLLLHLRPRAEARPVRVADDIADALPWFLALGVATFSALGALIARRGWGWVGVFAVSAIALLVLPLAHLPPMIGLFWTFGALGAVGSLALRGPPDHEPRF